MRFSSPKYNISNIPLTFPNFLGHSSSRFQAMFWIAFFIDYSVSITTGVLNLILICPSWTTTQHFRSFIFVNFNFSLTKRIHNPNFVPISEMSMHEFLQLKIFILRFFSKNANPEFFSFSTIFSILENICQITILIKMITTVDYD